MKPDYKALKLETVSTEACCAVRGGLDKQAQEALWMIGYVVGLVAKFFSSVFSLFKLF